MQPVPFPPVVKAIPAAPHEVCGACESFEPARNEPAANPKYGYCKCLTELDRERSLSARAKLVDATTLCFILSANWRSGRVAFIPKKVSS